MVNISKGCDEDGPDETFAESRRLVQGDRDIAEVTSRSGLLEL